jgi:hypothetical protein
MDEDHRGSLTQTLSSVQITRARQRIESMSEAVAANTVQTAIWWVPLVSALIGAVSALATSIFKDFLVQKWNEARQKSIEQRDIFRNYAAPLAAVCERLTWRFNEIFLEKRHHFLMKATLPLVYNEYKRKSTLYRIATLLGWIRALNLELDALPRGASGFLTPLSQAIAHVQSALADGPDVEILRLEKMCSIWRINIGTLSAEEKKSLSTRFEIRVYNLAGDTLKHDSNHLKTLDDEKKRKSVTVLGSFYVIRYIGVGCRDRLSMRTFIARLRVSHTERH